MTDDPNFMRHHAARMLENPAWSHLFEVIDAQLARERDALTLDDPARQHVSIAQSLVTRIKRRAVSMGRSAELEDVNAANAQRAAGGRK